MYYLFLSQLKFPESSALQPTDILKSTELDVDPQLLDRHQKITEAKKVLMDIDKEIASSESNLAGLEAQNAKAAAEVEKLRERAGLLWLQFFFCFSTTLALQKDIQEMEGVKLFMDYREHRENESKAKEKLNAARLEYQKYQRLLRPLEDQLNHLREERNKTDTLVQKRKLEIQSKMANLNTLNTSDTDLRRKIDEVHAKIKHIDER